MDENTGKFLAQQLYPDIKNWIATCARTLKTPIKKAHAPHCTSLSSLLNALNTKQIYADTWVTLECKPSLFGPFLRRHFLPAVIGHHTSMRLGPPLVGDNPFLAMMGQVTTHLKPVGLFPPIGDNMYQICLYPKDANVVGMIGVVPGVSELVEYIPAVASSKNTAFCGTPCRVQGIIRQVPAKLFTDIGVPVERWEECRQAGNIWFLDLSLEEAESEPLGDATAGEMWGAMYASGHLEIKEGHLALRAIVENIQDILRDNKFDPYVTRNQAGRREILVYSKGIRVVFDTTFRYSLSTWTPRLGLIIRETENSLARYAHPLCRVLHIHASPSRWR